MAVKAYLQITMNIDQANRKKAAKVYFTYKKPFLNTIDGAKTKALLIRNNDVQVLHGFDSLKHAKAYLNSDLFKKHVFAGLSPLWKGNPEICIYEVADRL